MKELHARVAGEVRKVVVGQAAALEDMLAALALGGHVLLEGVPGTAKTLLASATARALGIDFRRLQFTPDMLPSDVTGTMALRAGELVFRPGPVFAGVVLADEINRTPPKTQAALLEAMQGLRGPGDALEQHVAAEGERGEHVLQRLGLAHHDLADLARDAGVQLLHDRCSLSASGFARTSAAASAST